MVLGAQQVPDQEGLPAFREDPALVLPERRHVRQVHKDLFGDDVRREEALQGRRQRLVGQ